MQALTREDLNKFLSERPQLTLSGISKEAGKGRNALGNSLPKEGGISLRILNWLLPVLRKYGYE